MASKRSNRITGLLLEVCAVVRSQYPPMVIRAITQMISILSRTGVSERFKIEEYTYGKRNVGLVADNDPELRPDAPPIVDVVPYTAAGVQAEVHVVPREVRLNAIARNCRDLVIVQQKAGAEYAVHSPL